MSTSADAGEVDSDESITRLRFRLDGLKETVRRLWAAMHGEEAPKDYDPFEDERRFYQRLLREQRFNGGHGGVIGNNKIMAILISINIALTGAVSSWIVSQITKQGEAINDQGRDIAVIKCQIDPKCRVVVSNDKP